MTTATRVCFLSKPKNRLRLGVEKPLLGQRADYFAKKLIGLVKIEIGVEIEEQYSAISINSVEIIENALDFGSGSTEYCRQRPGTAPARRRLTER